MLDKLPRVSLPLLVGAWSAGVLSLSYLFFHSALYIKTITQEKTPDAILLENKLKIIRFLRSPISNQQSLPMTLALAQSHAVDQHLTLNAVSILIIQLCNHYATFVGMLSLPPLPTRDDSSPINISTHVQRRFAQFQDDDGLVHIIHFADLAELCILDIILNDVDGIQH